MTNVFEVRFGQETRIGEDQLTIKSKNFGWIFLTINTIVKNILKKK